MPRKLRAELLLGDRADRLAGVGESHEEPQHERHGDHDGERDDARDREERGADLDDVEGVGQVDRAGVGAKRVEQRVLDHDREPERHQQDVAVLAMRGRADDEALQAVAEQEEQRREADRGDVGIKAEQLVREERREHRSRQQRAVREVDDVQDAVDQRQPERDQRIDGAGHQSVEHRGNEDDRCKHRAAPPP